MNPPHVPTRKPRPARRRTTTHPPHTPTPPPTPPPAQPGTAQPGTAPVGMAMIRPRIVRAVPDPPVPDPPVPSTGAGRVKGRRPRGAAVTRARVPLLEHARLLAALTPRDRWILRMLAEHRVMTTSMFVGLAFPSPRSAQLRLRALFDHGVINRFQPLAPVGSAPMHWILDGPGHAVLTAEDDPLHSGHRRGGGGERNRRAQALAIAHSHQLTHLLQVNTALTTLAATTTATGGGAGAGAGAGSAGLVLWWSQTRATRHVGDFVHPDAYAHYRHHNGGGLAWFYEHDRGSEPATQIAAKLGNYHDLARATAITTPVLVWLPSRAWEATVRDALTAALDTLATPTRVPIATTSPTQPAPRPGTLAAATPTPPALLTGPVWLPLTRHPQPGSERLSLARLALLWPHQPGRDHTASPLATTLNRRGAPAEGQPARLGAELAAPHPTPPPAAPHPARR